MNAFVETFIYPLLEEHTLMFTEVTEISMSHDLYMRALRLNCIDVWNGEENIMGMKIKIETQWVSNNIDITGTIHDK